MKPATTTDSWRTPEFKVKKPSSEFEGRYPKAMTTVASHPQPLLSGYRLTKTYGSALSKTLLGRPKTTVLSDVSIDLRENEITAVIGESGSGKTTLSRILLGLIPPTSGRLSYKGKIFKDLTEEERKFYRRDVQVVFQDPSASLNPRHRIHDILQFVIRGNKLADKGQEPLIIESALNSVGLPSSQEFQERFPHQLSGGQQQRVAIARAFLLGARLVIADEPLASLDASTKKQVLDLIIAKKHETGTGFLIITHDLGLITSLVDRVIVMYRGSIVEHGTAEEVLQSPSNPYTKRLLGARLSIDPMKSRFRTGSASGFADRAASRQ